MPSPVIIRKCFNPDDVWRMDIEASIRREVAMERDGSLLRTNNRRKPFARGTRRGFARLGERQFALRFIFN